MHRYNALTPRESIRKGMAYLKNAFWAIGIIAVAAGILAGFVLYSVSLMRNYERRILTGDLPVVSEAVWICSE